MLRVLPDSSGKVRDLGFRSLLKVLKARPCQALESIFLIRNRSKDVFRKAKQNAAVSPENCAD